MKQRFDNLVNSILNETFNSNSYKPEDAVECPYKLQDSLREKGIEVEDEEATEMYDKYRGKPFGQVEKEINANRSKQAGTTPNPHGQTDKQDPLYSQIKVDPREQTQY